MIWKRLSRILSLLVIGIGFCSLAGWVFGIDALKRIHPAWVTMKANTAVCLILAGLAVAILRDEGDRTMRVVSRICAALIGTIATLTLFESVSGRDLGIDQALFRETQSEAGRSVPGRMGPASAVVFILFSAAICLLDRPTRSGTTLSQYCSITASVVTFLIFLGYFYDVALPPEVAVHASIALHTVLAFLMLSAALLLARPDRGFVPVFLSKSTSGMIARWLLLPALLMPALLGWLLVLGRQAGYYADGLGEALVAVALTVIFTMLIWWLARALERAEAGRDAAEAVRTHFAAIVASSDDAILSKTTEGIVTSWNDAAGRIFGYTAAEMIGQPILRIIPPDRHNEERDILVRIRAGEHIAHYETIRVTKDGRMIDVSLTVSPLLDAAGVVIGASTIARDITRQKKDAADLLAAREAAEAANRAKDEFLAALSHELRTPLTPVLMLAADMEESDELPESVRQNFAMIRRNVELEARIIDDLLDLTRITHGKLALRFEVVDVHAVIEHALAILSSESAAKNLRIVLELAAPVHHARADSVRLQQVFWNLLKNAMKFTGEGGRITVRSWNDGDRLRVSTTDTGLGITPDEMPRIFAAFKQGHAAGSARFGGLGLGLSITDLLVKEHQGRIWAESAGRDQGATFHLELPTAQDPVGGPSVEPAEVPAGANGLRVLLVEDHADTRVVLEKLIARWGHSVTVAGSVAEAREALARGSFDILLSDLGLSDGCGFDVIESFRSVTNAPAIAMSGFGMESDISKTRSAGFAEHIIKPVAAPELRQMLSRFAARHAPQGPKRGGD